MHTDREFVQYPLKKVERIQPDCPVYIHAYTLTAEPETGAAYVQVRMVNRSERKVQSVFLRILARDPLGTLCYELNCMPVAGVHAKPHSKFGEDHVLLLPECKIETLEIMVEDILFTDGMIWRRQEQHRILTAEEAGWKRCRCGMYNPTEAASCALCGKSLLQAKKPTEERSCAAEEEEVFIYPPMKPLTKIEQAVIVEPEQTPIEPKQETCEAAPEEAAAEMETVEEAPAPDSPDALVAGQSIDELMETLRERLNLIGDAEDETEEALQPEETEGGAMSSFPTPQLMGETAALLQEMQRRIELRDSSLQRTEAEDMQAEPEKEQILPDVPQEKEDGKGIGLWIFLTVLMLILAAAAIAWVLYKKGIIG